MWVSLRTACWPSTLDRPDDVAGADDRARDGAAALRERRDGLLDVVEVGVADKGAIVRPQGAVDADVELVLMVGVVGGAACSCWRRRSWSGGEAREQGGRGGIEAGE